MTQSGLFVLHDDGSLVSMKSAQFATEDDFQRLLEHFPELLVGDQIDPVAPRRWALVKREQAVSTNEAGASLWSIDHLFLDQDGIPTLVEIKRQSDSRIRREVVGQMLDYAANCATYWSVDMLQEGLEKTCVAKGMSSEAVLSELVGSEVSAVAFWEQVKTNLIAGRIRMLFVADRIPLELRRIVEFLNQQMDPAEVLAIELRQFAGQGLKTLVPMVFGQTQEASNKRSGGVAGQRWDEEKLFEKLEATSSEPNLKVARAIFEWMRKSGRELLFGTSKEHGSVYPLLRPSGVKINPMYLSTEGGGRIWLNFKFLDGKPVFGSIDMRRELLNRFSAIEGAGLTEADLANCSSISLSKIAADPKGVDKVISALNWINDKVSEYSVT
jgi:hypothetical protein